MTKQTLAKYVQKVESEVMCLLELSGLLRNNTPN